MPSAHHSPSVTDCPTPVLLHLRCAARVTKTAIADGASHNHADKEAATLPTNAASAVPIANAAPTDSSADACGRSSRHTRKPATACTPSITTVPVAASIAAPVSTRKSHRPSNAAPDTTISTLRGHHAARIRPTDAMLVSVVMRSTVHP